MKNYIKTAFMAIVCLLSTGLKAQAQTADGDVFVTITDHDLFSRCFNTCDSDGDGKVTYAEARQATTLILDLGGRLNIIEDLSFLKFFPNLTTLSVGNTTLERIDLSVCPKLERLSLANGLWVSEITLAVGCHPEIVYPMSEGQLTVKRIRVN